MKARRVELLRRLQGASAPVTGSHLADTLGVSRQVIVADVAVLRAQGHPVTATPRGYIVSPAQEIRSTSAELAVSHAPGDTAAELYALVGAGVRVVDVTVEHPLYGDLRGNLLLSSRSDVDRFLERVRDEDIPLLSKLTDGVHLHRIEFDRVCDFRRAEEELRRLGFLAEG